MPRPSAPVVVVRAALLMLALLAPARAADGIEAPERAIKAAYLYKFLSYVDWPDSAFGSAAAPITIGVAGADDVEEEALRLVAGRSFNNRPIRVRTVLRGEPIGDVQLLFVGASAAAPALIRAARERPVLTVTEDPAGLASGSAINFVVREGRVRFEVAPGAAERGGLRLSSRLLSVALRVDGAPAP